MTRQIELKSLQAIACGLALFAAAPAQAQVEYLSDADLSAEKSASALVQFAPEGRILEEGPGFQLIQSDGVSTKSGVPIIPDDQDGLGNAADSHETYAFTTLSGLYQTDLPAALKQDLFREYGFDSSVVGPSGNGMLLIDVDAAREAFAAGNAGPGLTLPGSPLLPPGSPFAPGLGAQNITTKGFCSKKREPRSKTKEVDLTPAQRTREVSNGSFEGTVNYSSGMTGKIKATVNYVKKRRCGVTYGVELTNISVQGEIDFEDSEITYSGTVYKLDKETIAQMELFDLSYDMRFAAGPFVIVATVGAEAHAGLDLEAEVQAGVGLRTPISGRYSFDYNCDRNGCRKVRPTENTIEFDPRDIQFLGEVDLRATLTPWLEVNASAKAGLYSRRLRVARARVGARIGVPAMLWGYAGNMCGDADGDGRNEFVTAALLDLNADLYVYADAKVFGKARTWPIDLGLDSPWELRPHSGAGDSRDKYTYRRHLLVHDFVSGGSSALSPMLDVPADLAQQGSRVTVAARPCVPYLAKNLTYAVDFGSDGFKEVSGPASGVEVDHGWQHSGRQQLAAYITTDSLRRDIEGPITVRQVDVLPGKANLAPSAEAGPNQHSIPGRTVWLRGSGSDPDGSIQHFSWRQLSGPAVVLRDASSANASFALIAPPGTLVLFEGTLVFELTVTDDRGATATDVVSISVQSLRDDPVCWRGGQAYLCSPLLP